MGKSRYWATIVYEDSVDKFYIEKLKDTLLEVAISPWHNKDKYTEWDMEKYKNNNNGKEPKWKVGETKKAHRHILICYPNTTTESTIKPIVEDIKGVELLAVKSKIGYYEYLTHKNEKDKYRYNEEDIELLNGFKIEEEQISPNKKEEIKRATIDIINNENITEYRDIYDYCKKKNLIEFCEVISKNTIFFNTYLKSKHFTKNKQSELTSNIDYSII